MRRFLFRARCRLEVRVHRRLPQFLCRLSDRGVLVQLGQYQKLPTASKTRPRARAIVLTVARKEESASIGTCARRLLGTFGQLVDIHDSSENIKTLTHRPSLMNANIATSVSTSNEASPSTLPLVNDVAPNQDWSHSLYGVCH